MSLRQRGNVGSAETQRLKTAVDAARGVMRSPASRVFEQTNGADAAIGAEVEPVQEARRNSDQVARFDLDTHDRAVLRVKVKQPPPFDDEPHLVIVVPVLAVEFGQHLVQAGRLRLDVDYVGCDVAAALFELLYLVGICGENLFRWRVRRDLRGRLPDFINHADARQIAGDRRRLIDGSTFFRDCQNSHNSLLATNAPWRNMCGQPLRAEIQVSRRGAWLHPRSHPRCKGRARTAGIHARQAASSKYLPVRARVHPYPANCPGSVAAPDACVCAHRPDL